jgi:hypothetical protein
MKYLLIDFGASFIKTRIYNKDLDSIEATYDLVSPFKVLNYISKKEIYSILIGILDKYQKIPSEILCY